MPLTPDETACVEAVSFDRDLCELVKSISRKRIERLLVLTTDGEADPQPGSGISIAVEDGEEAEPLMDALKPHLVSRGYSAFWSVRRLQNGLQLGHEIAILKTTDPYAMIRIRASDGGNYGITTDDIIHRLTAWKALCDFEVVGAASDWVALTFSRLPDQICAFAEEIYLFCPDIAAVPMGLSRAQKQEVNRAAKQLCPKISQRIAASITKRFGGGADGTNVDAGGSPAHSIPEEFLPDLIGEVEMGIRLLAQRLRQKKYLYLWWD